MTRQMAKTRLQAERFKRQWTQAEIAEQIGVDTKTFGRWERGDQVANPAMRRALSRLFNEDADLSWFVPLKERTDYEAALELSRLLGGLPLTLEQAAAYIHETKYGLDDYK